MSYSKPTLKRILLIAALTLAIILTLPLTFLQASAATLNSSSNTQDAEKAYYSSDYQYLNGDDSPVFESITLEEAIYLFQQKGNYLILLGGSWCGNTTASIEYINKAAKEAGVNTIYNLDFRLDGTNADTHIRETNTSEKLGKKYNYLYGELVTRYLTNLNDWVEYTVDNKSALTYTNSEGKDVTVPKVQVPFLFVYNKDNTVNNRGESEQGKTYPIVYGFEKMIYRDEEGLFTFNSDHTEKTRADETKYVSELKSAIFDHIGDGDGKVTLSPFTDADYIRLAYNEKSGKEIFKADEQINIRTLTYKQLEWLLNQSGNYLILFGGSWCGNTQAVINIINDYAVANNVTVYNFDTKLDGGYAKKFWGYEGDVHIRDSENIFANLYVDLVKKYFENIETEYTIDSGKYIYYLSDPADENSKVIANKLQVPYFLAYNKDAVNNDGHNTPILGYVEKMYVLDETKDDYIGNENNYKEYTSAAFNVVSKYAEQTGITAVDIAEKNETEISETQTPAANAKTVQGNASVTEKSETVSSTESVNSAATEKANNGNVTKIIVAVVGVVVIAGVVIFVVVKKKNSSGGGHCC